MLTVDLNDYSQKIRARMFAIRSDITDKATVRTLNKVAAQTKTAASREIRDAGYNLKAADVKAKIKIIPATSGNPVATVKCVGRPIPLIKFSARQTKAGVSVNVKNGRKVIKDAFIATMPSGHTGVYVRVGKAHRKVEKSGKAVWSGLPIKQLFGPAIPDAFGSVTVSKALLSLVKTKFPDILSHEIKFLSR